MATTHPTAEAFIDAFYVDSWVDADALKNPSLKPRGFKSAGPFRTYQEAWEHVGKYRPTATHFKVRKFTVRAELVTFITNLQPPPHP